MNGNAPLLVVLALLATDCGSLLCATIVRAEFSACRGRLVDGRSESEIHITREGFVALIVLGAIWCRLIAPQLHLMRLIACGILALVVSIWQYRWTVHYLWGGTFAPIAGMAQEPMNSPVLAIGILLIFIGLFAFSAAPCVRLGSKPSNR